VEDAIETPPTQSPPPEPSAPATPPVQAAPPARAGKPRRDDAATIGDLADVERNLLERVRRLDGAKATGAPSTPPAKSGGIGAVIGVVLVVVLVVAFVVGLILRRAH
jgi:hypothetical protein